MNFHDALRLVIPAPIAIQAGWGAIVLPLLLLLWALTRSRNNVNRDDYVTEQWLKVNIYNEGKRGW